MPGRIDEIMEIAARYDIPLIEDAAEGLVPSLMEKFVVLLENMGAVIQWK